MCCDRYGICCPAPPRSACLLGAEPLTSVLGRSVATIAKPFVAKHRIAITAAPGRPTRHRPVRARRIRRLLTAIAAVMLSVAVSLVAFLVTLPAVSDAEERVQRALAISGAHDSRQAVPVRIGDAIIAVEDASFRANPGVDVQGFVRGVLGAVSGGPDRGGSTITQQLAKALYTGNKHGVPGKLRALGLAVKLAKRYRKDEILEMYANVEYFGHGAYGIDEASRTFFHRAAAELDWAEASMLAGLLQAPSRLDPISHFELARARQRHVLDRLVATHALTSDEADTAYAELSSLDR